VAGGIIIAYAAKPAGLLDSATFSFARPVTYEISSQCDSRSSFIPGLREKRNFRGFC
jgi:hypothetical protein